ncbi:MAG: hypothetical protein WAT79_12065 [Saprospiraceae bacterium]
MDKHIIDKWAAEELKGREITPSKSVWDQLENQLDQKGATPSPQPTKPNKRYLFWVTGTLLLMVVVSTLWPFDQIIKNEQNNITSMEDIQAPNLIIHDDTITTRGSHGPVEPVESEETVVKTSQNTVIGKNPAVKSDKILFVKPLEKSSKVKKTKDSQTPESTKVVASQPIAQVSEQIQEQISSKAELNTLTKNEPSPRINADRLLAEVNQDLSRKTPKYNIDPNTLLLAAEKESKDRFFTKVVKTLTETSTAMYVAVNNRNVIP